MKQIISWLLRHIPRPVLQRISGLGLKVISLFYQGNAVQCPVCGNQFRKFLPFGRLNPRPSALCPSCQSLERHRLIWLYLQQSGILRQGVSVLHIAPEACFIPKLEALLGDTYVTTDLESPLAKVKSDIHHMPFGDASFDLVLCNHVLEHVKDDVKAMIEIRRVMKPGGRAILQVPFYKPVPEVTQEDATIINAKAREAVYGQDDHVRRYGKDYTLRMEKSGLKVEVNLFTQQFSEMEIRRYGLAKGEGLYIGHKE